MKDLYIKTKNGNIQIDKKLIDKYNIKQGTFSPFSKYKIVTKNGSFINEDIKKIDIPVSEMPEGEGLADDEIAELPYGAILSDSEIIDFSQGTDSSMEHVKRD